MHEKQRETVDARIASEKKKFLEVLEKSPVVSVACERAGVSKATFYRWKAEDKAFADGVAAAMSEGKSLVSDIAIAQLIAAIKDRNLGAIKFWLEKHHPDYKNSLHVTAEIEREVVLSPEQEKLLRRALQLTLENDHGV